MMNEFSDIKPLGISPEISYERNRIRSLCEAIIRYAEALYQDDKVEEWAEELHRRVIRFNQLKKFL
jgi:hypothetical protein